MDNKSVTECVIKAVVAEECAAIEARRKLQEEPSGNVSRLLVHLRRLVKLRAVNPDGGPYGDFLKRAGGGPAGFIKRMGRHFVSWYLEPAFRRQTDFNKTAGTLMGELIRQIGDLEDANIRLKAQNERLERELAECQLEMARRLDRIEETISARDGSR